MKLRNKQTGEIVIANVTRMVSGVEFDCGQTLAELSAEWEDYEEPKEYWYLSGGGEIRRTKDDGVKFDRYHREIGNYFSSREEAEKAVQKLKAWKRLRDKGFRFEYYDYSDRDLHNHIQIKAITNREVEDSMLCKEDLDLLFGGEE